MKATGASLSHAPISPSVSSTWISSCGPSAWPRPRRATRRPRDHSSRAISSPRSGWRGTRRQTRPGTRVAAVRCASATAISSPSWVEAASHSGRPRSAESVAVRRLGRSGGAAPAFSEPEARAFAAPSRRSRAAPSSSCASTAAKRRRSWAIIPGARRQPRADRSDIRALTSAAGAPEAAAASSSAGQISLSTQTQRSGRQWATKRFGARPRSRGANWWRQPSGRRAAISSAEVRVPVVTSTETSGRAARSSAISPSTESDSPTLAAWNQASGPGGRSSPGSPSFSRIRARASLPRAARLASSRGASGPARRARIR